MFPWQPIRSQKSGLARALALVSIVLSMFVPFGTRGADSPALVKTFTLPDLGFADIQNATLPDATPSVATPPASASPVATAEDQVLVEIRDDRYHPSSLRIAVGTTVRWTNLDGVPHTAETDDDDTFGSGPLYRGGAFTHRFDTPGVYRYVCAYHLEMGGTVTVRVTGSSTFAGRNRNPPDLYPNGIF